MKNLLKERDELNAFAMPNVQWHGLKVISWGFECSTHYTRPGRRLDQLAATQHDRVVALDFAPLREYGIYTVCEGIHRHRIEETPGHYTFANVLNLIRTPETMGMQMIWDLIHFGYPDDVDLFDSSFIKRYAKFAGAFMRPLKSETDSIPFVTPNNEISFLAFQGERLPTSIRLPEGVAMHLKPSSFALRWSQWNPCGRARYQAWDMLAGRLALNLEARPNIWKLLLLTIIRGISGVMTAITKQANR